MKGRHITDSLQESGARVVEGAISSFRPGGHYICLTFDEGAKPLFVTKIMTILKEKKIHATFFLEMHSINNGKNMITESIQNGHEIAILGPPDNKTLLAEKLSLFKTNKHHMLTRPHHEYSNENIADYTKITKDMKVILWSLDAKDKDIIDAKEIAKRVIKLAAPGDVILMRNDIFPQTVDALPIIIDGLTRKGYEFLTISEILSFPDDSPH